MRHQAASRAEEAFLGETPLPGMAGAVRFALGLLEDMEDWRRRPSRDQILNVHMRKDLETHTAAARSNIKPLASRSTLASCGECVQHSDAATGSSHQFSIYTRRRLQQDRQRHALPVLDLWLM